MKISSKMNLQSGVKLKQNWFELVCKVTGEIEVENKLERLQNSHRQHTVCS